MTHRDALALVALFLEGLSRDPDMALKVGGVLTIVIFALGMTFGIAVTR